MITIQEIEAGQSLSPQFTIYSDNGITPYNLSDLDNVRVWFIDNKSNSVLKKYSMNASTGHDTDHFSIVNAAQGKFKINIESSVSALFDGVIRFEIAILDTVTGFTDWKKITKENIFKANKNLISE